MKISILIILLVGIELEILAASASDNGTSRMDVLVIVERSNIVQMNEQKSSVEVSFEISYEWESKKNEKKFPKTRELTSWNEMDYFGILTENIISTNTWPKCIITKESYTQNVRAARSVTLHSEKPLDFSAFPNDAHLFQLRLTSVSKNSSQLTLHPHFVPNSDDSYANSLSNWHLEITKAFVQWVVHKNESFEQAVFEFKVSRKPTPALRVTLFLMFLVNVAMIFECFPISGIFRNRRPSGFLLCSGFLIAAISACEAPKTGTLTSYDYQLMSLLLLGVLIQIFHEFLPFCIFHLRCCPIEAEPSPPMFPSPSDQFSLDTERSKCNAALDSARAESVRSPRVANFDMCLAEVKYTMSVFNEVLNLHSSAEWRRKLWHNAYHRFEVLAFVILQIINCTLFSSFCQ